MKRDSVHCLEAIDFLKRMLESAGAESVDMFLCDLPYTFKHNRKVTANHWDLPIDDDAFFNLALQLLTPEGVIALIASQPFTSYLVYKHLDYFRYEWIWEKSNGSNFIHVKHQPFKVHESILIFGKASASSKPSSGGRFLKYNPQFRQGEAYKVKRGSWPNNFREATNQRISTQSDGRRYPRSILKFKSDRGLHPTQKPVKLFEHLISTYTDEEQLVVDVSCGSGTTAEAAVRTGRHFIVNDLYPEWVDVTKRRVKAVKE